MTSSSALADPYGDLRALLLRADRVCPRSAPITRRDVVMMAKFTIEDTVIESRPLRVWQLDPDQFPSSPPSVPSVHQTAQSRRWFVGKHVACSHRTKISDMDNRPGIDGDAAIWLPRDARLWHPSDAARKLLVMGRRDLDLMFASIASCDLPLCDESLEAGTVTLFSTPSYIRHSILYKDSIEILALRSPYLARLCDEYAHMMCWLYGLTLTEFGELAHLYISRHDAGFGKRNELIETTDNGRYTGGPFLSVGVGRPYVFHDFNPVLAKTAGPVRVKVGEGTLLVLDGYARIRYTHGHPATEETNSYYTLNFQLDCTRRTLCTGVEKVTRGIVTYTPFLPEHVVSTRTDAPSPVAIRMDSCPMWTLLMEMHTRLKVAESHLLTCAHKSANGEKTTSPCPEEPARNHQDHPAS